MIADSFRYPKLADPCCRLCFEAPGGVEGWRDVPRCGALAGNGGFRVYCKGVGV